MQLYHLPLDLAQHYNWLLFISLIAMIQYILVSTGPLPSPEYVHVNELINSSTIIKWNPPYTALNNESDFVHVDPHIIKYTVYIIDNFTGNCIDRMNVTETQYIIRSNTAYNDSCPLYSVTAWNSGGEGRRSIPLPGYTPQSELLYTPC